MALIGYARVSTETQDTSAQKRNLRAAGCEVVHEEQASGAKRSRPVLARLVSEMRRGDILVVVRIDRLARSLSHLLEVIETLEAKEAHFRSLGDPIDTTSPQGKFTLQILGATAEFERALIRERTMAGLASAREQGRVGGNPGLRRRDPDAIAAVSRARDEAYMEKLTQHSNDWVPVVQRFRPRLPWEDVVRILNGRLGRQGTWTVERLRRATKRYVTEGLLDRQVLGRATPGPKDDRLVALVAGIKGADPDITLQQIAERLEAMREPTPRGRSKWATSTVDHLIKKARKRGLLPSEAS